LIILLPAGFIAGAFTSDVNPELLLGAAFQPLVSLAVAVILLASTSRPGGRSSRRWCG
jgi:hypothetical protein